MPDATGRLTAEDNQKIAEWWKGRWSSPVQCPVCKTGDWSLGSHVVNITRHAGDAWTAGSVAFPHIMVFCKNCAHTMFFNAVMIGVAPAHEESETKRATLKEQIAG